VSALKRAGFIEVSQKGSHQKLSDGSHVVIVPLHDEVARGTLKSILEQASLELNDFMGLL